MYGITSFNVVKQGIVSFAEEAHIKCKDVYKRQLLEC